MLLGYCVNLVGRNVKVFTILYDHHLQPHHHHIDDVQHAELSKF